MEYRIDKEILYISLQGRIDASNSADVEAKINEIRNANPGKHTVLDADALEYISSAGLRVLLSAQKKMKQKGSMIVKNVCAEIMEVFEITGFADILTIARSEEAHV